MREELVEWERRVERGVGLLAAREGTARGRRCAYSTPVQLLDPLETLASQLHPSELAPNSPYATHHLDALEWRHPL